MVDMPEDQRRAELHRQLAAAGLVVVALAAVGALLGLLWDLWSPASALGIVSPPGIQIDDEYELTIGADGRYVVMTAAVGIVAGVAVWFLRRVRGPWMALGLAVGGLLGSLLTDFTGHLLRGMGSYEFTSGGQVIITGLPLSVQAKGLWFLQPALAALVYSLLVSFAADDDLGRPDPGRPDSAEPAAPVAAPAGPPPPGVAAPVSYPPVSAPAQGDLQYGGGDGDAPGLPQ